MAVNVMSKKYPVILSDDEYNQLKLISRKKNTSKTLRQRCQILMHIDEAHGKKYTAEQTSNATGVCKATVYNVLNQYTKEGLKSVITLKRSINSDNTKRKLDGRSEAKIIEIACEPAPEGHSRWTLRLLEEECKIRLDTPVSKDTIGRALKKINYDLTKVNIGVSPKEKTRNS